MNATAKHSTPTREELAGLIGIEGAGKLLAAYGGEIAELPTCKRLRRAHRDSAILDAAHKGESAAALSEAFGIGQRTVRMILSRGWAHSAEDYELFMPASFCELARCVGLEAAEKLCESYGGHMVCFPEYEQGEVEEDEE